MTRNGGRGTERLSRDRRRRAILRVVGRRGEAHALRQRRNGTGPTLGDNGEAACARGPGRAHLSPQRAWDRKSPGVATTHGVFDAIGRCRLMS